MYKILKNSTYGTYNKKYFFTLEKIIKAKDKRELMDIKDQENLKTIQAKHAAGTKLAFAERNILNIAAKRERNTSERAKMSEKDIAAREAYFERVR